MDALLLALLHAVFPSGLKFRDLQVEIGAEQVHLQAASTSGSAPCPQCGTVSTHRHSHYCRTLLDVSWAGFGVLIKLDVRRFRCRAAQCSCQCLRRTTAGAHDTLRPAHHPLC
ncbi:transposase family protein [Deinococcus peraridilitoris]|uniref:transposase family protein n=1 Tax=Deinococcus peraridilitoris TaxID=432329 RepID=UPI0009FE74D9